MTSPQRVIEARSNRTEASNRLFVMNLYRRALGHAGPVTFFLIKK